MFKAANGGNYDHCTFKNVQGDINYYYILEGDPREWKSEPPTDTDACSVARDRELDVISTGDNTGLAERLVKYSQWIIGGGPTNKETMLDTDVKHGKTTGLGSSSIDPWGARGKELHKISLAERPAKYSQPVISGSGGARAIQITLDNITEDDKIIALMGPTGTGKSTFIHVATGMTASHKLESHTSEIRAVRYPHPTTSVPFVFVDTPGFNDTNKTDAEVLAMIAGWLETMYKRKLTLCGIIYLHPITINRIDGRPLKDFQMFGKLCGDVAIKNVVLATTMWTKVNPNIGRMREEELKAIYWQGLMNLGSRMVRFGDSFDSAWKIIDEIVDNHEECPLLIQEELVDLGLRLGETAAGKSQYTKLQLMLAEQKEFIVKLREEARAVSMLSSFKRPRARALCLGD